MQKWFQMTVEKVIETLNSDITGLKSVDANNRLEKYGKNEIPKASKDNVFVIFLRELKDPIVLLLIVIIIFCFMIGEVIDAVAIVFIVLIDLLMGTFQEAKALKNAEALSSMIRVNAKVIRNNQEKQIASNLLVPGDIVLLESGDKISADLRVIDCYNFQVNESILTGESLAVNKSNKVIAKDAPLSERFNMLFAGTSVITGRAKAVVVATGLETEIGKIADKVNQTKEEKSPLTIRMEKFSKQISVFIVLIAIIISFILYLKGYMFNDIFLLVISLSVSAMPEGLPLALTMALTIGSNRMASKNVIVKKLNAVESLGSCTVIASDKTGTLTVNQQTAKKILLPDGIEFDISGIGYNDNGLVTSTSQEDLNKAILIGILGVINNEALLEKRNHSWEYFGDSIDVAFLALGKKLNIDITDITVESRIPYESENKYSAVFYKSDNKHYCTVKGSLEKICSFCTTAGESKVKIDNELLKAQNERLASNGYRVIAIADGEVDSHDNYNEDIIKGLNFIGLVAFIDTIREEVKLSLKDAREAGIKVVMITGDHPLTAFSIARELNLVTTMEQVATGEDIACYLQKGQKEFDKFIQSKSVFSRVTPIDKLEIVESYKRQGEFVAVTGDGVNDAPALKSANIGVAMGSGTDVAKETASMIIIDDNFKSIVAGIKEGRNAYSNIRKVSYMLLSCGIAEVLFFLLSIAFDLPMPLVAIQLLWLNVVTDGLQDFALSFEKSEKGIMKEKPRRTTETLFNKELISEVLTSGFSIGLLVFSVWLFLIQKMRMDVSVARGYIMALMVFIQNIHVLNCRSERESTFKVPFNNPLIVFSILTAILLQIIVMEVPLFSKFLKTESIPFIHLIYLFILSIIILGIMEIYKAIKRKRRTVDNCK